MSSIASSSPFDCSMCTEDFNDPQVTPCGHTFCKPCITAWVTKNKTCPDCRKDVTSTSTNISVKRMMDEVVKKADDAAKAAIVAVNKPLMEHCTTIIQTSSSSLSERTAVHLHSDNNDITIDDSTGQEQVKKLTIKTAINDQTASVSFLTIDQKLLEQTDKKESKVIKDDIKPVCYPRYFSEFYCSYDEIVSAIESWGKVEAILNDGLNHIFIISFRETIKFSSYQDGIMVNLTGGHGISDTPFSLRGMYRKGSSCSNVILSNKMMAFDIRCLRTGHFDALDLWESQWLLPDERLSQIKEEVGNHANWENTKKKIDSTFSESDK